jgi:hypothetical protein
MELSMQYIPDTADYWDVKQAISDVMHSVSFVQGLFATFPEQQGLVNFDIDLPLDPNRGLRNQRRGSLYLPKAAIGYYFRERINDDLPVRIGNKRIKFIARSGPLSFKASQRIRILKKTRFLDPEFQKKRQSVSDELQNASIATKEVHIGFIYEEGLKKIFCTEFRKESFGRLWIGALIVQCLSGTSSRCTP